MTVKRNPSFSKNPFVYGFVEIDNKGPGNLSLVQGCEIKFKSIPIQSNPPLPFNMSTEEEMLVDLEVQNLLAKGAIEICSQDPNQFISNLHHPEEGWGEKASGRHARAKSVCSVSSIQDGGYIAVEGYPPERRLHDKAGPAR